jgi:rSAM/selenodomain-associated transferase 1
LSLLTQTELAAAIFVKTPGRSPIKTRLARELGEPLALEFYRRSCAVLQETLEAVGPMLKPYWAVAEDEPIDARWRGWAFVTQGAGDLGARLHQVYEQLLSRHRAVILLGADAPQLSVSLLREAIARVEAGRFVMGPAADCGFYLFAGADSLPATVWTSVQYSQADTRMQLQEQLRAWGQIELLPPLRDVDEGADFFALATLQGESGLLGCQNELIEWCREQTAQLK